MDKIVIKTTKTRQFRAYGVDFEITDESYFTPPTNSYNRIRVSKSPLVVYKDEYMTMYEGALMGISIEPHSGDPEEDGEFAILIWKTDQNLLMIAGLLKAHIELLETRKEEVLKHFIPELFGNNTNVKAAYRFQLARYIVHTLSDYCIEKWRGEEAKELAVIRQDTLYSMLVSQEARFRQEVMQEAAFASARDWREICGLDEDVVNWLWNHRSGWNKSSLTTYLLIRDFMPNHPAPSYQERTEYEMKVFRLIRYLETNNALNKATAGNSTLGRNNGTYLEVKGSVEEFYGIDPDAFETVLNHTDLRFSTTVNFPIIAKIRAGEHTWDGEGYPDDFDIYTNPIDGDEYYWVGYHTVGDYTEEYLGAVKDLLPAFLKDYMEGTHPDLFPDFEKGENRYWFVTDTYYGQRYHRRVGVAIRVWAGDNQLHPFFEALYDNVLESDRFDEFIYNSIYETKEYDELYSNLEKAYVRDSLERNDAFPEVYIDHHEQSFWEAIYWLHEELMMEEEADVEMGEYEISDEARDAICFFMATHYPEMIEPSVLAWVISRDTDRASTDADYNQNGFLVSNSDLDWEGSVKLLAERVFKYPDGSEFVFDIELPDFEKLPLYPAERILIEHVHGSFVNTLYIARIEEK